MTGIELKHVTYTYPNCRDAAVKDLNLSVAPGEIKLVTGASGCGKTTIMRLVNGLAPQILGGSLLGEVSVNGLDAAATPVASLAEHIGTLFQDPEAQFFALNVGDEIAFALKSRGFAPAAIEARVADVARRMGITALLGRDIHALSEGQKQKVGLAGILALGPKALILDEPTANLDPEATEALARLLGELKAAGAAILIVDHRLYWLKDLADEVLVMRAGEICRRGPFSMLEDEALRAEFGLRRAALADPRTRLPRVPVAPLGAELSRVETPARLGVKNLRFAYPGKAPLFSAVSFEVPAGITALIGDNGTGKTTLARILTGLESAEGDFSLDGESLGRDGLMPSAGLVLQNADHQLQMRTVREEVEFAMRAAIGMKAAAGRSKRFGLFAGLRRAALTADDEARIDALLSALRLSHLAQRHPQSLSGGEKQRLVIACALVKDPAVLILDEPTSGLDGANMAAISALLKAEARKGERGRAVFLITHDLELLDACDRALDMACVRAAGRESDALLVEAFRGAGAQTRA